MEVIQFYNRSTINTPLSGQRTYTDFNSLWFQIGLEIGARASRLFASSFHIVVRDQSNVMDHVGILRDKGISVSVLTRENTTISDLSTSVATNGFVLSQTSSGASSTSQGQYESMSDAGSDSSLKLRPRLSTPQPSVPSTRPADSPGTISAMQRLLRAPPQRTTPTAVPTSPMSFHASSSPTPGPATPATAPFFPFSTQTSSPSVPTAADRQVNTMIQLIDKQLRCSPGPSTIKKLFAALHTMAIQQFPQASANTLAMNCFHEMFRRKICQLVSSDVDLGSLQSHNDIQGLTKRQGALAYGPGYATP
eukprot:GILJ01006708.1.p1 GENE.GILJ01006708.1~~GILJ01006708.1.p1  ORF type:complete len:337 (+),score=31.07 GILJ01006708.1:91-1011(+)